MNWPNKTWRRLLFLFRRERTERELDEEVRFHLEKQIEESIAKGMSAEEALNATLRAFGGVEQIKEECRDIRGVNFVETLIQDIRYGLRMLRRSPGFTGAVLLCLSLGIGANTALFSVINAFMLRMIPVSHPDQLVLLSFVDYKGTDYAFSYPAYKRFQGLKQEFSGMLASEESSSRLKMTVGGNASGGGQVERVDGQGVSGNYFSVLGVDAVLGRIFTEADDQPSVGEPITVISYTFWKRRFGLDPTVVGRNITLNQVPFTIVGVLPPGFEGVIVGDRPDLWWPLRKAPRMMGGWDPFDDPDNWWLTVIARMQPGATASHARAGLDVTFHQMLTGTIQRQAAQMTSQERQRYLNRRIELEPASTGYSWLRQKFSRPLVVLMATVGVVLLIACANVANLLLARASARQREVAVRLALGAGRRRLIRQLLTESVILALMGGAIGLIFAYGGSRLLVAFMSGGRQPLFLDVHLDPRVLSFTFAVSLATGILFGLAPALRVTRVDLTPALKDNPAVLRIGRSRITLSRTLVAGQVALSLLLLVAAGLLVRSLQKLRSVDAGFDAENLILFSIDSATRYTPAQQEEVSRRILNRLQTLPGTRSVSYSGFSLLEGSIEKSKVAVEGYAPRPDEDVSCYRLEVGTKFFETMGIPLLLGRDFSEQELVTVREGYRRLEEKSFQRTSEVVLLFAVINEAMARYFFGSVNPVGKHFIFPGYARVRFEIIGVVKDAKYTSLRDRTLRTFYLLYPSKVERTFELRTFGNTSTLGGSLPRLIQEVDPNLLVTHIRTMSDVVDQSLIRERFTAHLSGFFSLFALLLDCIGLYGIMAYSVARRTHEIGIRMALGAERSDVLWMVMRDVLVLVFIGIAIGIPVTLAAARLAGSLVSDLLFGLKPGDPVTIGMATLLLVGVALLAGYLPAQRAAKVEPMVALRYE